MFTVQNEVSDGLTTADSFVSNTITFECAYFLIYTISHGGKENQMTSFSPQVLIHAGHRVALLSPHTPSVEFYPIRNDLLMK